MKLDLKNIIKTILLLLCLCMVAPVMAQIGGQQDLSSIRVDELSDEQVRSIIRQVEATGMGDDQLEQVAQARGMRADEVQKLRARVNRLKQQDQGGGAQTQSPLPGQSGRQVSSRDTLNRIDPMTEMARALEALKPKIWGTELFKNANPVFEPNLRLPTPVNYQIGPDDQIIINVYGNSLANWTLTVTPEGNINIPGAGILNLSGRTIEQATTLIKNRLIANNYAIGRGTNVLVSLGNIRSIKVILNGEVVKPGTYSLPSVATVFNALYASGGPSENGSFRQIEVIRGNKVIAILDVYNFLLRGFQNNNITLRDQDVIHVPVYTTRVEFAGEVKRPGIFEALPGESLQDVLNYAGGFSTNANTSKIRVFQNTGRERRQADVNAGNFNSYKPGNGDKYFVDRILERFANRVIINGAVFYPGQYALDNGLTLTQLIKKAEGLKEDAFLSRGYIIRLKADNTTETISFDLGKVIAGTDPDPVLQREDIINISSIFDLREEYKVSIDGEVRQPGDFFYSENMSLEDLITQAGGFKEGASPRRIDISRRVKNSDITSASGATAQVYQVDVDRDLKLIGNKFILQPFDIVTVRGSTGYEIQRQVIIEGEVLYPGPYTLQRRDERISDLIRRAGGLTALAYPEGASLKRSLLSSGASKNSIDNISTEADKLLRLEHLQRATKDSTTSINDVNTVHNNSVGINLEKILLKPGSDYDLIMEEGDTLRISKQLQTVTVSGEVLSPITIIYKPGQSFKKYISQAGGFSDKSMEKRSYILYANGAVKGTRKLFFFNDYPQVKPGAEIFVPRKPDKKKLSPTELIGISTGLASLAAIIISLLK